MFLKNKLWKKKCNAVFFLIKWTFKKQKLFYKMTQGSQIPKYSVKIVLIVTMNLGFFSFFFFGKTL